MSFAMTWAKRSAQGLAGVPVISFWRDSMATGQGPFLNSKESECWIRVTSNGEELPKKQK